MAPLNNFEIHDIHYFEKERPQIWTAAHEIEDAIREEGGMVILLAKVKTGKRELTITLALRNNENIVHIYGTKLDRLDIKDQFAELSEYGVECRDIRNEENVLAILDFITKQIKLGKKVWFHLDESDYGTGAEQILGDLTLGFAEIFRLHPGFLSVICYSATNEEALFSKFRETATVVCMKPAATYRGSKWFLDNNLVVEAEAFCDPKTGELTAQGEEAIIYWLSTDKPLAVTRFASSKLLDFESTGFTNFKNLLAARGIDVVTVTEKARFSWGKRDSLGSTSWKTLVFNFQDTGRRTLIVMKQTCTRSTEVSFHKYIAFWHDYRNGELSTTAYNTLIQAYGRPFHHDPVGHQIRLYASKAALEVDAVPVEDRVNSIKKLKAYIEANKLRSVSCRVPGVTEDTFEPELLYEDSFNEIKRLAKTHPKLIGVKIRGKGGNICSHFAGIDYAAEVRNGNVRSGESNGEKRVIYLDGPANETTINCNYKGKGERKTMDAATEADRRQSFNELPDYLKGKYVIVIGRNKTSTNTTVEANDDSVFNNQLGQLAGSVR